MDVQEKYERCTSFLKDQVHALGFTDVVIGLSGGIDSALVATLCVDALGADKVHGVLLPGPYSSSHSIDDAQALGDNLGIEHEIVSIVEPYEAFERVLSRGGKVKLEGLTAENIQARCRMVCLMALSNRNNWLMINTGNKSEAMMGYSTLYGDTAGALAPLGGLYKTDVFALSHWRNEQSIQKGEVPPIPENTIEKPPSAELSPNQNDERSMGLSYAKLDPLLITLEEEGKSIEEAAALGYPKEEVERIKKIVDKNAFKRALEPPFPKDPFYA
ncbi:MAG: NAD(+) synthase [Raoultibacter sp.]|jgi:NAD+ synthetase